ncbi:MAG: TonB-dependent receptor [Chitinophagaceae bacterium]|nr:TonB-dependent receptor [Chitinophagaceae bacterium]
MKLTAILLFAFCLHSGATGFAQSITLSVRNAPVEKVLKEIRKQTGYSFFYKTDLLRNAPRVNISVKNAAIQETLDLCFAEVPVEYSIVAQTVVISHQKIKAAALKDPATEPEITAIEIRGTVTSNTGEPLPGASVRLKGTNTGTTTDAAGNFSLNIPSSQGVLQISFVGYITQEINTAGKTDIKVALVPQDVQADEVVVVGYGSAKKKDLTGSVGVVNIRDQYKSPIIATEQMLEGQVSGVQVSQNQSQPGGAVFSIRIRGTNSINSGNEPLYVIDGYAGGDIVTISPSDIASISVLKDASATAIYGSRGANGVVMITTKRGNYNAKGLTIDAYTGVQKVAKKYKMMDAKQFATYLNQVQTLTNQQNGTNDPLPYTDTEIGSIGKGTDWQDAIFRQAPVSNITIGMNGGSNNTRYYTSLSYFDQKGIMLGSDYKRGIIRFNVDHNMSSRFKMGLSSYISYDYQKVASVNTGGGITSPGVLWDAVRFNPAVPVKDDEGNYTFQNGPLPYIGPLGNPVAYALMSKNGLYRFASNANFFAEYEMLKGLKLRSALGAGYDNRGNKVFTPSSIFAGAATNGYAAQSSGQHYNWLSENTITYDKTINNRHVINAVGGFTFQHWYNKGFSAGITNLANNNLGYDNLGIGDADIPSAFFDENVLTSFFGRINYSFADRYLLTATVRADGSSRFGDRHKWGYFPSGAFAWNVAEENFMKSLKSINALKLRLSYGVTGNQEIGDYISLPVYVNDIYSLGRDPSPVTAIFPVQIANPDIKWEQTATADIGLDIGLWNNRVEITADYYNKKTSNLLLYINVPRTSGYESLLRNVGAVQNKGFEFSLTSRNIVNAAFTWESILNFSTNKNKVLDIGTNKEIYVGEITNNIYSGTSGIIRVGQPIGTFYGYQFDGIWQTQDEIDRSGTEQPVAPGDPKYRDLDGDKSLTGLDRAIIGQALPKFIYGFTNNFKYGRLGLTIFLQGIYGNKIFNENRYEIENGFPIFNKLAYVATDSWNGPNTSNTLPSIISTYRRGAGFSSDMLENGSFLRVKTVTLSYDLPLNKLSTAFKAASVYVTAQNLLTFTKYSGYDPEVNSFDNSNQLSLGTDYNAYPNYRTFLAGVRFSF